MARATSKRTCRTAHEPQKLPLAKFKRISWADTPQYSSAARRRQVAGFACPLEKIDVRVRTARSNPAADHVSAHDSPIYDSRNIPKAYREDSTAITWKPFTRREAW